jgi:DoxX-like protein
MNQLGFPVRLAPQLAVLEIILLVLYLLPRTSVLGALLWTGYLGGAIAVHVRVGDPLFSHVLFPVYIAFLLWGGLYLREDRLRQLLPVRS